MGDIDTSKVRRIAARVATNRKQSKEDPDMNREDLVRQARETNQYPELDQLKTPDEVLALQNPDRYIEAAAYKRRRRKRNPNAGQDAVEQQGSGREAS